jgi:hypothetical protein
MKESITMSETFVALTDAEIDAVAGGQETTNNFGVGFGFAVQGQNLGEVSGTPIGIGVIVLDLGGNGNGKGNG